MCYIEPKKSSDARDRMRRFLFSNAVSPSEKGHYDAELNPRIIAPDPFASYDFSDDLSYEHLPLLTRFDEDIMNSEDEPSFGLNGRLRPRKSAAPSPQAKAIRKLESKPAQDRPKRTSTPSKAAASKPDDLPNKSEVSTILQVLCPYCDRKFASKQTVSKHASRIHLATKQDSPIECLFCNFSEADPNDIIRHMVDNHPNQYFACLDCHTRFLSTSELAEHKLNVCEKQKEKSYRSKLRQKVSPGPKKSQIALGNTDDKEFSIDNKDFQDAHRYNGVVISCELKPSHVNDEADIEDNITTNLILPPSKTLGTNSVIEKNAVIVLDDIQWNKRMPTNFSFHNTDADQILSRLGVVHRSPRTGETTKKDWFKNAEEPVQKFEKCFDTAFYSKVASNVHENLSKFLDGSFNFNPDPDSIIKTRKSKYSVVINTAEGFPILLAFEQFSRNVFDGYIPRTLAPKHKWKWENDKSPLNPDDIKRDSHVNNCIITLISSLDIWTQLCMRRKFEDKFSIPPLAKKTEKQNAISKELKQILESRELPTSSQQVVKYIKKSMPPGDSLDFPTSLGLKPSAPTYDMQPAVLSGEWVRPRCYVCCACGAQTRDSRGLSAHISTQHPNAQVQHYEIVGELLLNADILKHLYVPPSQLSNRTRPLRGFRECTKCKKSISLEDLHQHMLDCAGDTPAVRRKCRYRPFGVRRRRPRLPDNTIRKKIRKDIRSRQTRQKTHMRQRPKIRSEVGDAETIRKMLADLPAKRHRVMVNPMNPILRPRRKLDNQRNKIIMNRRTSEIAKNRKKRDVKKGNESYPSGSNIGEDDKSNKSDDDNKPLKPKIKRVLTHGPRHNEALKRKVALNRAKRRAKMKEQKSNENTGEQEQPADTTEAGGSTSSNNHGDQLSIDNTPQRIDVNEGPYGAREHSSRGSRSNNRDSRNDQRSGSDDSPNGNINNSFDPMRNVPLKHSIARLTAETDAHNMAMQYHHLYLMQPPDCPEIDMSQHVSSGQHRVFENEAVVTKLDKPPLHFNLPTSMDAYAYRNKLPKPKKGLNDCIAMLKNKLVEEPIPATKMSHAVQCGSDDRLDCDAMVHNQRPAVLDFQLNMNSRPAEIYSRHQLIPERYMEYPNEVIAQNFQELPFHYLPTTQRITYDLPPPDNRIDPRYMKSPKQKQSESNNKKEPIRRRSTRTDKNSAKKQDLNARTPPEKYAMNIAPAARGNSGQGRRSSSQNISANANVAAKRRASVSYNRSNSARKSLNEYEAIMAQQRALEFRQQRISPEAHLMEMTHPETYTQTQIKKQNQLIAEQMIENYINKNQLAICVDTNYANKMLTAAYAERMYANSRHASISPRNNYDNSKHASVSPQSRYDNHKHLVVSPDNRYDSNRRSTTVSPGGRYDSNKQAVISPGSRYDNNKLAIVSPGSRYDNSKHVVVSPGSRYGNSKQASISPGNKHDNSKQVAVSQGVRYDHNKRVSLGNRYEHSKYTATVSPGSQYNNYKQVAFSPESQQNLIGYGPQSSYDPAKHAAIIPGNTCDNNRLVPISPEIYVDNNKHANISPGSRNAALSPNHQQDNGNHPGFSSGSKYVNRQGSTSPGSNYISKKQAAVAAEGNHNSSKNNAVPTETQFVNNKQAATSENNFHKNATGTSSENVHNTTNEVNTYNESGLLAKVPTPFVESAFISKKAQAVASENKLNNKDKPSMNKDTSYSTSVKALPHIDRDAINETRALLHAEKSLIHDESNYADTQANSYENALTKEKQNSAETSLSVTKQSGIPVQSSYVSKDHTNTSERHFIHENQADMLGYANNQVMQCSENNFVNKESLDVQSERDSTTRKIQYHYSENEYNSMRSVSGTYAAIESNYEQVPTDVDAPLDLSKSTLKDNDELLKEDDGVYASENYDNYETLDLSNKGSEQDCEDVVVDLSVKISSPNLNVSSKLTSMPNDETDSATDLSIKVRDSDDSPTDLTVKKKTITEEFSFEPSRNPIYNDRQLIQDLSGKKTSEDDVNNMVALSGNDIDPDTPTDLSGKTQNISSFLAATQLPFEIKDPLEDGSRHDIDLPADFSGSGNQLKQDKSEAIIQSQGAMLEMESDSNQETYENRLRTSIGESSYNPNKSYDPCTQTAQYKSQLPACPSEQTTFANEMSRSPNNPCSLLPINETKTTFDDIAFTKPNLPLDSEVMGGNTDAISLSATHKPVYQPQPNTIMPLSMSKYESTTPVYTLANACISMAKAESSSIAPLSDSLLSIPSTTIVNVAPVYTLTETTVNSSMNYMQVQNKSTQELASVLDMPKTDNEAASFNTERQNISISSSNSAVTQVSIEEPTKEPNKITTTEDLDPETAKKIALLPKELVEILGTMPVDHRKQLLNVLPQYVSTSTPSTLNDASDISATSHDNRGVSPSRLADFDIKPTIGYSPVSSSQIIKPVTSMIAGIDQGEETKTFPMYQKAFASLPVDEAVGKYEPPEQTPKVYEIDGNTVIDLTEDDAPLNNEVLKVIEDSNKTEAKSKDIVTIPPPQNKTKQKVNDQTASLRAVRIKAPSERNKSVSIDTTPAKKSNNEQPKLSIEMIEDKDISSDLDKTLAIQQAEISSTQHNTTIVGNCKYPLAISPNSTEYSGDESSKPVSQQSPTPTIEVVTEKLDDKTYEKPVLKTGMVSSSISHNEVNLSEINSNGLAANDSKVSVKGTCLLPADEDPHISTENASSDRNLSGSPFVNLEDDSDDDISLAAIVKQKQFKQVTTDEGNNDIGKDGKTLESKKQKKDKKGKKVAKKSLNSAQELMRTSHTLKDSKVLAQSVNECPVLKDGYMNKNEDHVKIIKHSKKRAKKGRRVVDTTDSMEKEEDNKISEIIGNIENDQMSEVSKDIKNKSKFEHDSPSLESHYQAINKESLLEDKAVTTEPEVCEKIIKQKSIKDITVDPIIKISKCDDKLSAYSAISTDFKKNEDRKSTPEISKVDQVELKEDVNEEQVVCTTAEKDKNERNVLSSSSAYLLADIDSHYEVLPKSGQDSDCLLGSFEPKKGKRLVRKKTKTEDTCKIEYEVDSSNNISNTLEMQENLSTPLRRSRRGKSLFMDSPLMEQDSIVLDDATVEPKAPLTKKQMIFSKLLHDEVNPKPAAHSTPETIDKPDVIPEISDIENTDEPFSAKAKGTKRRISVQFPKKTKKKKSIDGTNSTDISDISICEQTVEMSGVNLKSTIQIDAKSHNLKQNSTDDLNNDSENINELSEEFNDKHLLSTEKRKNNNQISFDLSQSSKPKKTKLNKNDKKVGIAVDDKNVNSSADTTSSVNIEIKTACYNLPLPARRARSKSVVVKSSTYDPYDIDFEDMLEQSVTLKKKDKSADLVHKNKTNKSANKATKDVRKDHRSKEAIVDKRLADQEDKKYVGGNISDSDDSSKSDVPLQKYVDEKEKKILEVETLSKEKEFKVQVSQHQNIEHKIEKVSTSAATVTSQSVTQTQADEELRSEQFMESFGFFSERKPRKSNLLATKKISETFHITNESDDMYFGFKERPGKRNMHADSKKAIDSDISKNLPSTSKRLPPKRGRRMRMKKVNSKIMSCYCGICQREFRRPDNYLRHQMSLLHVAKLSLAELKVKTLLVPEEPNHLIAYKQYHARFIRLTDLLAEKRKKYPKAAAKIVLPTVQGLLEDVNKTVTDQQRRNLSLDEALFVDCCELLSESHLLGPRGRFGMSGLDILEKAIDELEVNEILIDDDDCDSITAQNILESEEVRNLENDLISGFKEAADATRKANIEYQQSLKETSASGVVQVEPAKPEAEVEEQLLPKNQVANEPQEVTAQEAQSEEFGFQQFSSPNAADNNQAEEFDVPAKPKSVKVKKHYEVKEKMYPDIQPGDIDMYEDKFDKIKRKCRSQAAAAKHPQPIVDQAISHKARKKSEKKKGKRCSKKSKHQSTHVPTKGALKGFDGIKISIPTSDINMSAIVPVSDALPKKKKKSSSKKKRDKRDSESSCKYDSDHRARDSSAKKVDVYEFMDNEDAELFEFRPSTLMERFKSISNNNKELPSTSKFNPATEEISSQGSASDGDDFVYMSDDYVGSDDETENSLLSCDAKVGGEVKKNSPQKRRDAVEKNAVMGKIFKHNAVRAEKKIAVPKEPEKPKANLDQLFDSLLEEEPNSSMLNSDAVSPKNDELTPPKKYNQTSIKSNSSEKDCEDKLDSDIFAYPSKSRSPSPIKIDAVQSSSLSKRRSSTPSKDFTSTKKHENFPSKKYDQCKDYGLYTSKKYDTACVDYEPSTSKKYHNPMPKDCKKTSPKSYEYVSLHSLNDDENLIKQDSKNKKRGTMSPSIDNEVFKSYDDNLKSPTIKADEGISTSYDYNADTYDQSVFEDETGVARHRARRKCTVGKQNILAETWSSESEPDGGPPRPNSAESNVAAVGRKKKGRKREGQQAGGRRGNSRQVAFKRHDAVESRVSSSRISSSASGAVGSNADADDPGEGTSGMCSTSTGGAGGVATSAAATDSAAAAAAAAAAMPAPSTAAVAGPSNTKGRSRPIAYYWSAEGDDEQEHLQQHGWIVGDSHKKLVTMLAHAKGRKRNNDEKRHLVE